MCTATSPNVPPHSAKVASFSIVMRGLKDVRGLTAIFESVTAKLTERGGDVKALTAPLEG